MPNAPSHSERTACEMLPLVYRELRRLAAQRLKREKPGQTLDATALVHEAYVRIVKYQKDEVWDDKHHFFSAAAEAMRRILVENARAKNTEKRGTDWNRIPFEVEMADKSAPTKLEDLDLAITALEECDPEAARLVKLRFFTGMTIEDVSKVLQISTRTANRIWVFAKAWLKQAMEANS